MQCRFYSSNPKISSTYIPKYFSPYQTFLIAEMDYKMIFSALHILTQISVTESKHHLNIQK